MAKVKEDNTNTEGTEWQEVEPKYPKHRVRRLWEWIEDLFGWRPSSDIYDELNADVDDRSPAPTPDDSDGEPG